MWKSSSHQQSKKWKTNKELCLTHKVKHVHNLVKVAKVYILTVLSDFQQLSDLSTDLAPVNCWALIPDVYFFSGFVAEHMDLRHFLTVGMISSGLFTIAFGLGYVWKIHNFAYFVTVQVLVQLMSSSVVWLCCSNMQHDTEMDTLNLGQYLSSCRQSSLKHNTILIKYYVLHLSSLSHGEHISLIHCIHLWDIT